MADIIQIRRDTAANWATANPILAQGEFGYTIDTKILKIGDGLTSWNLLSNFLTGKNSQKFTVGTGQTTFVITDFVLTDYDIIDGANLRGDNSSSVGQTIIYDLATEGTVIKILNLG